MATEEFLDDPDELELELQKLEKQAAAIREKLIRKRGQTLPLLSPQPAPAPPPVFAPQPVSALAQPTDTEGNCLFKLY